MACSLYIARAVPLKPFFLVFLLFFSVFVSFYAISENQAGCSLVFVFSKRTSSPLGPEQGFIVVTVGCPGSCRDFCCPVAPVAPVFPGSPLSPKVQNVVSQTHMRLYTIVSESVE